MDGITEAVKDIALEVLTEEEQSQVHLRNAGMHGFELICQFNNNGKPDQVGLPISISAFHKTESFHQEWKNRFKNLLDIKKLKLENSNGD